MNLDKWYTKPSSVQFCLDLLEPFVTKTTIFVEPSAGDGKFMDALRRFHRPIIGTDIAPERGDILLMDWLKNDYQYNPDLLVVGNPPFGKKGKLAVEFINTATKIARTIAFIVPVTLAHSYTAQKHINQNFKLVLQEDMPKNSFLVDGKTADIPCVFQIWCSEGSVDLRLQKPQTEHPDLEIRIFNKTQGAEKFLDWDWDIAVKRNSKKGIFETDHSKVDKSSHWILVKGPLEKLTMVDWSELNDNKMTAGIGKADVIKGYLKVLK